MFFNRKTISELNFKAQEDTAQVETEQKSEVTEATEGPDGEASEAIGKKKMIIYSASKLE